MEKQLEDRIEQEPLSSFGNFIVRKIIDIKNWPLSHKFYNKLRESLQKEKIELDKPIKHNLRNYSKRLFIELEPQLNKFKQNKLDYSIDILAITRTEKKAPGGVFSGYWTYFPEKTPTPEGYNVLGSGKNPRYESEIAQFYQECVKLGAPKPDPSKYNHSTFPGTGHYVDNRWSTDISEWASQISKLGLLRPMDEALIWVKLLPNKNK